VASALGWDDAALALDTSDLSPDAAKKAVRRHEAELLKKARAAVDLQKRALVADAQRRKSAGLDTVPSNPGPTSWALRICCRARFLISRGSRSRSAKWPPSMG
jgi:hypothetical protein